MFCNNAKPPFAPQDYHPVMLTMIALKLTDFGLTTKQSKPKLLLTTNLSEWRTPSMAYNLF
jgi:hypothetical protein